MTRRKKSDKNKNGPTSTPPSAMPQNGPVLIAASVQSVMVVNTQEYNSLVEQNTAFKNQINAMYLQVNSMQQNERNMKDLIDVQHRTIEELRTENAELQKRLKQLELDNAELKIENGELKKNIVELKKDIVELKKENIELKKDNHSIHNTLNKMMTRQLYNKYIVAIQDVNRIVEIEKIVTGTTKNTLKDLRENRVNECHYINDIRDSPKEKENKRTVLFQKIMNIDSNVKRLFELHYPNLLHDISGYIVGSSVNLTDTERDKIEDWWEC
jgi:chromosome segregation ATPase